MKINPVYMLFLLLNPMLAVAQYADESPPQNIADFKYPKSGVMIVPSSEIILSSDARAKIQLNLQQKKLKGYYDSNASDASTMLSMKKANTIARQNSDNSDLADPQNTHIKPNLKDVGLAYDYQGIPSIDASNIIGFAAIGMWINNKGWTGSKEFFNSKTLGTCSFSLSNMSLAHGNVRIGEDSVRYDVPKKPGTLDVYGSDKVGFIYNISWYDNTYDHELECANPNYDPRITKELISYANFIDSHISRKLKY